MVVGLDKESRCKEGQYNAEQQNTCCLSLEKPEYIILQLLQQLFLVVLQRYLPYCHFTVVLIKIDCACSSSPAFSQSMSVFHPRVINMLLSLSSGVDPAKGGAGALTLVVLCGSIHRIPPSLLSSLS